MSILKGFDGEWHASPLERELLIFFLSWGAHLDHERVNSYG